MSGRGRYRAIAWPAIAALLLIAVWLFTVWGLGMKSRLEFERGDYATAAETAKFASAVTPFERFKPHFNRGTAWAGQNNLGPARLELERALELSPVREECRVRINLARVVEQQGDSRSGNPTLAARFYDHSRALLDDSPAQCRPPGSGTEQKIREAKERLDERAKEDPSQEDGSGEEQKDPQEEKREAVEEKSKDAADRQEGADRQQRDGDKAIKRGEAPPAKKPW